MRPGPIVTPSEPAGSAVSALFTVSDVVRNKAAVVGARGWVDGLPGLVERLATDWAFTPIRALGGGTESFALEVELVDAAPAVLKLLIPRSLDAARHEIAVLHLAGGDGCPPPATAAGGGPR